MKHVLQRALGACALGIVTFGAGACVTSKSTETVISGTMTRIMPKTTRGTFTRAAGAREYVVYRPATFPVKPDERALVVMMHGCTQNADDFAKGTRMNTVADSGAFLVLYPEQSTSANARKCWNWYAPQQFTRGQGEVAILSALIDSVAKADGVSAKHVSIVGMSAGAAMAANLVVAYPEQFAALVMHSGLAANAASDEASAAAVMKSGPSDGVALGARAISAMGSRRKAIPVLLLHGELDTLVAPANMRSAAAQFMAINAGAVGVAATVEEHLLPGVGHAWSGGAADGTYTAPAGPNASVMIAEFLRKVGAIL